MNWLEIKLRKILTGKISGGFKSFFRGSGLDFDDNRKYQIGDEIRFINRKLSAKHNQFFIKIFKEEKDTDIDVFFDINLNWLCGEDVINKDKVYDMFSDIFIYAKKYGAKVYGYYQEFDKIKKISLKTNLQMFFFINQIENKLKTISKSYKSALADFIKLQKSVTKRHVIIIFSDFLDLNQDLVNSLNYLGIKNELFMLKINVPNFVGYNFDGFTGKFSDVIKNKFIIV